MNEKNNPIVVLMVNAIDIVHLFKWFNLNILEYLKRKKSSMKYTIDTIILNYFLLDYK